MKWKEFVLFLVTALVLGFIMSSLIFRGAACEERTAELSAGAKAVCCQTDCIEEGTEVGEEL